MTNTRIFDPPVSALDAWSVGEYSYKSIKQDLMFGYYKREVNDELSTGFATMEKVLIDLLYLLSFYNTERDIADLRLDRDNLHGY